MFNKYDFMVTEFQRFLETVNTQESQEKTAELSSAAKHCGKVANDFLSSVKKSGVGTKSTSSKSFARSRQYTKV